MPSITGIGYVGLSVTDAAASAAWYAELLGMEQVREFVHEDGHLGEVLLRHPASGMELGLLAHRGNPGEPFSETRTGLDHLEFAVADRSDLDAWVERLDRLGIGHSGVKDLGSSAMVTFRDPDDIQLEFFWAPGLSPLGAAADLVTPMALRVAATLRVADHIAHGRTTAAGIAAAAGADPDALDRILRHLAASGVLRHAADGRYDLTNRGEELRDDHPSGLRCVLDIESGVGRAELALVHLLHSVRTGAPAYPELFGSRFWDDLAADPELTASFDAQMAADVAAWATHVVPAYDWGTLGHLVDVGGGDGTLLVALLKAHPELTGTVLDRPATAAAARARLEAAGLADRGDAMAGDFFSALPAGAGGYLLSAILHDWPDEAATAILRRCAEAAGAAGRVFVVEKAGPDGASPSTVMDLRLLAYFAGRERTVAQISALATAAGLRVEAIHSAGDLAVVELVAG